MNILTNMMCNRIYEIEHFGVLINFNLIGLEDIIIR